MFYVNSVIIGEFYIAMPSNTSQFFPLLPAWRLLQHVGQQLLISLVLAFSHLQEVRFPFISFLFKKNDRVS